MADEPTPYRPRSTALSSLYAGAHPIDVLIDLNPEIAGITYAGMHGLLIPELVPIIKTFRECQTQEKIARLRTLVDRLAIDADERKAQLLARTHIRISELEKEAGITQASLAADAHVKGQRAEYDAKRDIAVIQGTADVQREDLRSKTALELQRLQSQNERYAVDKKSADEELKAQTLQYVAGQQASASIKIEALRCNTRLESHKMISELNRYALEQNAQVQRHLSDNQARALIIETTAIKDAVVFIEKNKAELQAKKLDTKMKEAIRTAEIQYLTKIKEAEILRAGSEHHDRAAVIQTYLQMQADKNRAAIAFEIAKAKANSDVQQAELKAITDISTKLTDKLKPDAKKIRFNGKIGSGEINIEMETDDGR
jgi:hypothetical protein